MNRKLISLLLCCWPEDIFEGANEIWSNRKLEDALRAIISNGDFEALVKLFEHGYTRQDLRVTVYRKNLQHLCNCWLEHNSKDNIVYFYQESSPLLWAIDCHQWDILRAMIKRGIDPNRPLICRRWTSLYSKVNVVPYTKSWTKGKCTYQSALDYFLASIFEVLSENPNHTLSDYQDYFEEFLDILQSGVDVHRIDSIIIFNLLAASFNLAIRRYDISDHISIEVGQPNIHTGLISKNPQKVTKFFELNIFINLIENGFSQLDFIEYLNPCYNWFGILICLLSHPKIDCKSSEKLSESLPSLLKDAALLLINLLAMRNIFSPGFMEFEENYDNLNLRKQFVKLYTDQRLVLNERVEKLRHICAEQKSKPLKLKFLARTVIRKRLGGVRFLSKLKSLELPRELERFISYISINHLKSTDFPSLLVNMALGNHDNYHTDC